MRCVDRQHFPPTRLHLHASPRAISVRFDQDARELHASCHGCRSTYAIDVLRLLSRGGTYNDAEHELSGLGCTQCRHLGPRRAPTARAKDTACGTAPVNGGEGGSYRHDIRLPMSYSRVSETTKAGPRVCFIEHPAQTALLHLLFAAFLATADATIQHPCSMNGASPRFGDHLPAEPLWGNRCRAL